MNTIEGVYRMVMRFREGLDELIYCDDEVRRLVAYAGDFEPLKLLIEIYHDTLRQFLLWLAEAVEEIDGLLATGTDRRSHSIAKIESDVETPNALSRLGH